ncbi:MAG: polyprenyl synthetase family protein [Eubacterium sp.]
MTNFKEELQNKVDMTDEELNFYFEKKFDTPDIIVSAMKYSLFAGGKRLRPILMKETCHSMGGNMEMIIPLACAIEMIHTYSLIHDDLPAMDNDDLRRGKPTNHKVYGENIAILAGDALLNYAIETAISGIPINNIYDAPYYVEALKYLFEASGVNGMIGGQTGDLLSEDEAINEEKMYYIHAHKTGALLKASVLCGGFVAKATGEEIKALEVYSEKIGLAFQIVDDILDVTGDEKTLGKPIGSDEKNHKSTFVSLYGMASSQEKVKELEILALDVLKTIKYDTTFLEDMAKYICHRES